jgi:hypothetical protein
MIKELMSQEFYDQLLTDDEYSNSFVDFLKENEVYIDYTDKSTQESSTVPNSMKHRNKTPYKTKVVKEIPTIEDVFSLANPEEV